jgi:hypothetical protein
VNQHIPAPDKVNARCPDWKLLNVALKEFDVRSALLIQDRGAKRGQNYINSDCAAPELLG